jgi:fused signal recognition particle receptor
MQGLEFISIGVLVLLVVIFIVDLVRARARLPRAEKRLPQSRDDMPGIGHKPGAVAVPTAPIPQASTDKDAVAGKIVDKDVAKDVPKEVPKEVAKESLFSRMKQGLGKTRASLTGTLATLFLGKKAIDDDLLEEMETILLTADVGVAATTEIIARITEKVARKQLTDAQALYAVLKDELCLLLAPRSAPLIVESNKPFVFLVVGVNGVGKTTTIGKLAKKYQQDGKKVMLAAGDTFRAAAVEQLQVWGERNNVPVIAQHTGADSASVIFDAVQSAKAKGVDIVIADTAGRLQNKDNLMAELEKIVRVMRKLDPSAPHEVMLVLDAGTGQNALSQAQLFKQCVGVTGITLTKLDGTAKGGIIFAVAKQFALPIRFIGVGEQIDDLRTFDAQEFVDALFDKS